MIRLLDDLDAEGAAVGVRVDINSPIGEDGGLADDARLLAHVDTISELCRRGARVALLAHQGRPGGEDFTELRAHAKRLDELVDAPIEYCDSTFSSDARARIDALDSGTAVLLENTRFYSEEYMSFTPNDAVNTYLVCRLAPALDAYVNDAFATSHRRQPSIIGFPQRLPSFAGRVMERELDVLGNIARSPEPRIYVLGGAKVDDSIDVARSVLERGLADAVLTAGIVGNAFLLADGVSLGAASAAVVNERSHDAVKNAGDLLDDFSHRIYMPRDVAIERDG
ncbi:MAG: phosphoglycerate kinase, partial [Natronomonas sp.]|nr:phosphoglycerate kinase [Natronomonas sp.]